MSAVLPPICDVRVYGLPVAQPRVRTRLFRAPTAPLGVRTMHFTPGPVMDWRRTIVAQCLAQKPPAPVEGPLQLDVVFYLPRPASLPKRERFPVKRPDAKNLLAAVEDALAGLFYRDDAQLVHVTVAKRFDPAPGVGIRLTHLSSLGAAPEVGAHVGALASCELGGGRPEDGGR